MKDTHFVQRMPRAMTESLSQTLTGNESAYGACTERAAMMRVITDADCLPQPKQSLP